MTWISGTGNVFDELVTLQEAVGSTKKAFPTAVDGFAGFPFWMNYPISGSFHGDSAGDGTGLHTVRIELHVMRGSLPDNENELRPYLVPFYKAVWDDPTLNDTVDTVLDLRYTFRAWDYVGGEKHVGIEFDLDFKVREATS